MKTLPAAWAIFLGGALLTPSHGLAQQVGCNGNVIQSWDLVNASETFPTITGTISSIKLNNDDIWDDGDWNMFLVPDESRFLVNRDNHANDNGKIELEILSSGPNLKEKFPAGTRVQASGEWVQDNGHDSKTELHPLQLLRSMGTNPTRVFVAQDASYRFVQAGEELWKYIYFDVPDAAVVTPTYGTPSHSRVLHEQVEYARARIETLAGESVGFSVKLQPGGFSDCDVPNGVVSYGDQKSPYYFGEFTESFEPLVVDTMEYHVSTEVGGGQKIAVVKISAKLSSPQQGALLESRWTYQSTAGTVIGPITETKTGDQHKIEFTMPYCPALGWSSNRWDLAVVASTRPLGEVLPQDSQSEASVYGWTQRADRTFVMEKRAYVLPSSVISLDVGSKGSGTCGQVNYVTVDETRLMPQIRLRSLKWLVKTLKDQDGASVTATPTQVMSQASMDTGGFSAQTYASPNDKRLDIQWKTLASGLPNLSRIEVMASAVTELGEEISAKRVLSANCGVSEYSADVLSALIYRVIAQRGYEGGRYKIVRRASKRDRPWLKAFFKWEAGLRLTANEEKEILQRAAEGKTLPATKVLRPELSPTLETPTIPLIMSRKKGK